MLLRNHGRSQSGGFTLVEMIVALLVFTVVGLLISSFTLSETWLYAKNTAVNDSHRSARRALDRLANELQQSQNLPALIDTTGNPTTATPAPGLTYDRLVGSPYKINHPGGSGLPATAASVSITRSTNIFASPPVPAPGDVLLIDLPTGGPIRAQVAGATVTNTDSTAQQETLSLTLANPLGTAVTWDPSQAKMAQVVRHEAFIVMLIGDRYELRFYQSFEPMPALDDPSAYTVITDAVSTFKLPNGTARDATPFTIDTSGGNKLVKASLRMQAKDYVFSLAGKQANSFNTFVEIDITLPSRLRPKS
jgi:prepilin-type N-terminal cleavage/methylation domain-containing protein